MEEREREARKAVYNNSWTRIRKNHTCSQTYLSISECTMMMIKTQKQDQKINKNLIILIKT